MDTSSDRPDPSVPAIGGDQAPQLDVTARDAVDVGSGESTRDVFDSMPIILVGLVGPDHRCIAANAAYRGVSGRAQLVGEPLREILPEGAADMVVAVADRAYRSGDTQRVHEWLIPAANHEDGEPSESYFELTLSARRTNDGQIVGVDLVGVDVTDRVHARQAAETVTREAEHGRDPARDVVVELQRALLPRSLPVLPGLRLAARYLVAPAHDAAGGDWFDALALPSGGVALVVGDVVGHGVAASAAMGQLRAVVNESLASEAELLAVLDRVDAFARRDATLRAATLAIVEVDPATGQVRYALCGHPPPIITSPDGATRILPIVGGLPLGVGSSRTIGSDTLAVGETVLLYSDGLIETPDWTPDGALADLAAVAGRAAANRASALGVNAADRVATSTIEHFTHSGYHDDVTVLTAERLTEPVPPLDADGSGLESIPALRRRFTSWLDELQPGDDDRYALELAVGEALSNAVQHAYPADQAGPITIRAELDVSGSVVCEVSDAGHWRPPINGSPGGRGLWFAQQLVDSVHVNPGTRDGAAPTESHGTTVTVRHSLRHDAGFGVPATMAPARSRSEFSAEMTEEGAERCLRLGGHLDITTAAQARRELLAATRGGVVGATLDLTDVTLLGSAGVQVLFDVTGSLTDHDQVLAILAPRSSVAAQVLDLVGLFRTEGARPAPG
jgi:anti-anti-sigma factor